VGRWVELKKLTRAILFIDHHFIESWQAGEQLVFLNWSAETTLWIFSSLNAFFATNEITNNLQTKNQKKNDKSGCIQ
jgi:hypothetical protein